MSNEPLNLDESGEWAGLWWLPDAPEEQVPGVLHYDSEGGLTLSLIGAFEERIMSHPALDVIAVHEGTRTWDVIHERLSIASSPFSDASRPAGSGRCSRGWTAPTSRP